MALIGQYQPPQNPTAYLGTKSRRCRIVTVLHRDSYVELSEITVLLSGNHTSLVCFADPDVD